MSNHCVEFPGIHHIELPSMKTFDFLASGPVISSFRDACNLLVIAFAFECSKMVVSESFRMCLADSGLLDVIQVFFDSKSFEEFDLQCTFLGKDSKNSIQELMSHFVQHDLIPDYTTVSCLSFVYQHKIMISNELWHTLWDHVSRLTSRDLFSSDDENLRSIFELKNLIPGLT